MNTKLPPETALALVAPDKGLLAMVESTATCNKRFAKLEIQQPALEIWQGKEANVAAAQKALNHRAQCNRAARRGEYNADMETSGS